MRIRCLGLKHHRRVHHKFEKREGGLMEGERGRGEEERERERERERPLTTKAETDHLPALVIQISSVIFTISHTLYT